MSLLAAGAAFLLALSFGSITSEAGSLMARRAQAQAAADSAALAAIAASAPGGGGTHVSNARRYAQLNGASLRRCVCVDGATSVEVDVELDGVAASARAVLDVRLLRPLHVGTLEGLHPQMVTAVGSLLHEARGAVTLVSGYRTRDRQQELWTEALTRFGNEAAARRWVAPPGTSKHELGLAVDLGGDLDRAAYLVRQLGLPLHRPVTHEPWHFELVQGSSS